jgi:hypothetical protein
LDPVYVAGYPRSGNVWLSRLLGDALNSPVCGEGAAMSIAQEGFDRPGPHVVRQLCLHVVRGKPERAVKSAYEFAPAAYAGERVVYVYRDPRDVAVSAWKFFDYESLEMTLHSMAGKVPGALGVHGSWADHVRDWLALDLPGVQSTRFRDLPGAISNLLDGWGLVPARPLPDVYVRQDFAAKRSQIERDGDTRPYGRQRQLEALRRGIVGDWRNWFTGREAKLAHAYFWPLLNELGFEDEEDWWQAC